MFPPPSLAPAALGTCGFGLADGFDGLVFQQGGVRVVEPVQFFAFNGFPNEIFHSRSKIQLIRRHDRERIPGSFRAAGTADAVHIVFRVSGTR